MERRGLAPLLLALAVLGLVILGSSGCERTSNKSGLGTVSTSGGGEAGAPGSGGATTTDGGTGSGGTAGGGVECGEDGTRCNGRVPQRCSELGQWGATQAACAVACLNGECVECSEGDRNCLNGAARECRNGSWETVEVCEGSCEGNACVENCTPDRLQCNGSTLQICEGSEYVDYQECAAACSAGECTGECMPDAKRCDQEASGQAQTCNALGEWDESVSCANGSFCVNGDCKPCEPGSQRCASTGRQLCSDDGEWVPQGACADPTPVCFDGDCVTCDPGQRRCEGNTLLECDSEGSDWSEVEVCSGTAPACLESTKSCGRCQENDTQCLNDTVQVCDANGAWQTGDACSGATPQCVAGACEACDPAANERRCLDASTAQVCASDASWGDTSGCTGDLPQCREDLNFSCGCNDDDRRCRTASTPEMCSGGQWVAQTACSGTLNYCLAATGTCVDCQPGTETCQNSVAQACTADGAWTSLNACSGSMVNCGGCDVGEACETNENCVSGSCIDQQCTECVPQNTDCQNSTPRVCSSGGSWQNQSTCSGQTAVCDASTANCVQCLGDADCPSGTPVCTNTNTCVECEGDGDCPSGTPVCTNTNTCVECEGDGDCSGSTPVCDTTSNQCVACASNECVAAPGGWQGPVIMSTGTQQSPPTCPGTAPATSFQAFGDLNVPTPVCGCTCQSVPLNQQNCSDVDIGLSSAPCSSQPVFLVTSAAQDSCTEFTGNLTPSGQFQFLSITPSDWSTSASCTPQPSVNVPNLTWDEAYVACDLPTSCQGSGKCAPVLGAGQQLCIHITGDAQCPASFPNRVDTWSGASDSRGCSTCSCGDPSGSCDGEVEFREADCMPFRAVQASLDIDFCHSPVDELSGVTSRGAVGNFGPSGGTCAAANSTPQGTAAATGQRTVCCQ